MQRMWKSNSALNVGLKVYKPTTPGTVLPTLLLHACLPESGSIPMQLAQSTYDMPCKTVDMHSCSGLVAAACMIIVFAKGPCQTHAALKHTAGITLQH